MSEGKWPAYTRRRDATAAAAVRKSTRRRLSTSAAPHVEPLRHGVVVRHARNSSTSNSKHNIEQNKQIKKEKQLNYTFT